MLTYTKKYTHEQRKKASSKATHIFAALHSGVAFLFANTVIGDKAFLTILTVLMILVICKINGSEVTNLFKSIVLFAAFVFGSTMAFAIITVLPIIGNLANAAVAGVITEIIGYLTYKTVSSGESIEKFVKAGKLKLLGMFVSAYSEKSDFLSKSSNETNSTEDEIGQSIRGFAHEIADEMMSSSIGKASRLNGEPNINFLTSVADKFFKFSDGIAEAILESV